MIDLNDDFVSVLLWRLRRVLTNRLLKNVCGDGMLLFSLPAIPVGRRSKLVAGGILEDRCSGSIDRKAEEGDKSSAGQRAGGVCGWSDQKEVCLYDACQ